MSTCFPLIRVSPSSVGIYRVLMQWLALWPHGQVLPPVSVWVFCRYGLTFFFFYRFDINPTHQRMCLTTTPQVCSSPQHGNLFLPGLTGAFHTGLACCYCLSLLSITQIGAMCIHMHAFGTLGRPLAARSGGACASLCFLQQQPVTAAARHMSSVICMV